MCPVPKLLLPVLLMLVSFTLLAQNERLEISVLDTIPNGQYIAYFKYTGADSTLTEKGHAFLYGDSVVLHGKLQAFKENGDYRIGYYEHGTKISMTYFNAKGEEISFNQFYGNNRGHTDPEKGTGIYFIKGIKER